MGNMNSRGKFAALIAVLLIAVIVVGGFAGYVNAVRPFDKEVHGHVLAAYWSKIQGRGHARTNARWRMGELS